jgi:hypothetical protein
MIDSPAYLEEAKNNAQILSWALSDLASMEIDTYEKFALYRDNSTKFIELFKTLNPLLPEDRNNLYNQLQEIAYKNRRKQEERKKKLINASQHKKEIVLFTIQDAKGYITSDLEGLKKADELLRLAQERMRISSHDGLEDDKDPSLLVSDIKMIREDLEQCRQLWSEVKGLIYLKRKEIYETNYLEISLDLKIISEVVLNGRPSEAVKQIKAIRRKVSSQPMTSENTVSIQTSIKEYWDKSVTRLEEIKIEQERKLKERVTTKAKHDKKQNVLEKLEADRLQQKKEKALLKSQYKAKLREHKQQMIKRLKKLTEKQEMEHLKWEIAKKERKKWDIEKIQIIRSFEHETKKLEIENDKVDKKQKQKQMLKRKQLKNGRQNDGTHWRRR